MAFALVACQKEIKPGDVAKLNGYWEIEKVVLPNGNEKEYTVNETVDFFEIKGNTGFRKKVMPQLDGKYLDNGHAEQVKVTTADAKTYLNYATEYAKWKEEILELSDENLILKNDRNIEYHYKKPTAFTLK